MSRVNANQNLGPYANSNNFNAVLGPMLKGIKNGSIGAAAGFAAGIVVDKINECSCEN